MALLVKNVCYWAYREGLTKREKTDILCRVKLLLEAVRLIGSIVLKNVVRSLLILPTRLTSHPAKSPVTSGRDLYSPFSFF